MALLTEGHLGVFTSKTAVCLVRYCRDEVVAVIDSKYAGQRLEDVIGIGRGVPLVASVREALAERPDTLVIGVAPTGGRLADAWRQGVLDALRAGVTVVAGLHVDLADDPEFAAAARSSGARIVDVRKSPEDLPIGTMKAADARAFRVLTVGTDSNTGKMVAALELTLAARAAGLDARFVATGQTGIMIAGKGIAIDHVVSDFLAGAVERMVVEDSDADVLFIEGQGSLVHPGFSGVTLGLMHGALPQVMVLVHVVSRDKVRSCPREVRLPSLADMIELSELVMKPIFPSKVVAIALNTVGLADEDARRAVEETERATGLPTGDVIRFGAGPIFDAVKEAYDETAH